LVHAVGSLVAVEAHPDWAPAFAGVVSREARKFRHNDVDCWRGRWDPLQRTA
jgi:hypothetical protein